VLVAPSLTREAYDKLKGLKLEFKRLSVEKCIEVLESMRGASKISDFIS